MAVCGRCELCGHKFSGDGTDEAIRWECKSAHEECERHRAHARKAWDETFEHAICTSCHDGLVGGELETAVSDLVELLAKRRKFNE